MENTDGYVIIGTEIDTSGLEDGLEEIKDTAEDVDLDLGTEKSEKKLGSINKILEKITKKALGISSTTAKILLGVASFISKIGFIGGLIGALVLGFLAIGKSVIDNLKKNEKFQESIAKIKYLIQAIITALAQMLEPIAGAIVNIFIALAQVLVEILTYVGRLIKLISGIDIFSNEFANNMKKADKNAQNIKKSLAGFDEMNVLGDNSGNTSAGLGFDMASFENVDTTWVETLTKAIIGIGIALEAIKLAKFIQDLGLLASLPLWQVIAGVALILGGIILLVKGIIDFINDPSWENFLTILQGIALIIAGIAILMGGWIVALVALGVAIVAYVIQNWDKVKEILGVVGSWIYDNIIKPVADFFVGLWNGIVDGSVKAWEGIKKAFAKVGEFFTNIFNTIKLKLTNFGAKVGEAVGTAFKMVINGILTTIENIINNPIKAINALLDLINAVPGISLGKLTEFKLPRLAKGGIVNLPGRGVPIGGAIAGERSMEGVIPLTDSQQMELLGEAIGKYININASIPVYVGNRQIAREIRKIDANSQFATNS